MIEAVSLAKNSHHGAVWCEVGVCGHDGKRIFVVKVVVAFRVNLSHFGANRPADKLAEFVEIDAYAHLIF